MRRVWCFRIGILSAFLCAATAVTASAEEFEIRGPGGLQVFAVTDKGRVPLTTIGSDGRAAVPLAPIDRGKQLEVLIETCDGKMVAVLVERGRSDEACEDVPPFSGRCKCVRPGVFLTWGRLQRLTITGTGQVSIEGPAERSGPGWGVGWIAGGDVGWASLSGGDSACETARRELQFLGFTASCNSDTTVNAWGADFGVTVVRIVSVKVGYLDFGPVSLTASGAAPPLSAVANAELGRTRGVTFTGGLRLPLGRFVPYAEAGVWRWSSTSRAVIDVTGFDRTTFSDDNSGWDPVFAGGAEIWLLDNFALTAGARLARLKVNELPGVDAAAVTENFRMVFVGIRFGRR
jgi:hypothetical protein